LTIAVTRPRADPGAITPERLAPDIEELAERELAMVGGLDVDDPVREARDEQEKHSPSVTTNCPNAPLCACKGGQIPLPAGTWRGLPSTNMVRWTWM
jgi:hypothetical protein